MAHQTYTLEHRGEEFRMHNLTAGVVNHALVCNRCARQFTLDLIVSVLNNILDSNSPCRDVSCCQTLSRVPPGGIMFLIPGVMYEPKHDEPDAEPKRKLTVCRWCKGAGRITVNFKTKRCEECNGAGKTPSDDAPVPENTDWAGRLGIF